MGYNGQNNLEHFGCDLDDAKRFFCQKSIDFIFLYSYILNILDLVIKLKMIFIIVRHLQNIPGNMIMFNWILILR